jgi:hypothetical protein
MLSAKVISKNKMTIRRAVCVDFFMVFNLRLKRWGYISSP